MSDSNTANEVLTWVLVSCAEISSGSLEIAEKSILGEWAFHLQENGQSEDFYNSEYA